MRMLATIPVPGREGRRIELLQGDLAQADARHPFDLLVVSAFPGDYEPTPGSLIGALDRNGLSVRDLAADKALDLRAHFSCWLSRNLASQGHGFRRLLCFEPLVRGSPPEVVGDIFRSLMPVLGDHPEIRIAAMPIVAAGDQSWPVKTMLPPLLEAAFHWMKIGLPLEVLRIAVYTDTEAEVASEAFEAVARSLPGKGREPDPDSLAVAHADRLAPEAPASYDVFLSYAREDEISVDLLASLIDDRAPGTRIFLDRRSLAVGAAWQAEIFESLDRCRKVVALLSPAYLQSKVCKEEFNIAWARSRKTDTEILFPVYLHEAPLPTYMSLRSYVDCREADPARLSEACTALLSALEPAAEAGSGRRPAGRG